MDDDQIKTTTRGGWLGYRLRRGMLVVMWTGDEFLFGVRWTRELAGLCLGPFLIGYLRDG